MDLSAITCKTPRCGEIFVLCLIFSHSLVAFSSDQSVPRLAYKRHSALFSTCVLVCSALPLGATREKVIGHVEETATERNEPSHLYTLINATPPPYLVSLKNDEYGDSDDGFRVSAAQRCQC